MTTITPDADKHTVQEYAATAPLRHDNYPFLTFELSLRLVLSRLRAELARDGYRPVSKPRVRIHKPSPLWTFEEDPERAILRAFVRAIPAAAA